MRPHVRRAIVGKLIGKQLTLILLVILLVLLIDLSVDYFAGPGSVDCSAVIAVAGSDCSKPETSMDHYCSEPLHTGR